MRILVLADTHARNPDQLPHSLWQMAREADCVAHCGDYTDLSIVEELQRQSKRFVGVYGNTDPSQIRTKLHTIKDFTANGKRIIVVHPHYGGDPEGLEQQLRVMFAEVDVVLFGHTHEPYLEQGRPMLLNPGQGYSQFLTLATLGMLEVTVNGVEGEIVTLE